MMMMTVVMIRAQNFQSTRDKLHSSHANAASLHFIVLVNFFMEVMEAITLFQYGFTIDSPLVATKSIRQPIFSNLESSPNLSVEQQPFRLPDRCCSILLEFTIRAYTFSSYYFVEVNIVLPQDMLLNKAHNIGELLQEKL
ncbi:metal tolerance protein 9 [Quercus suber]|uniref:Metal tolerance protein 9 n=1 Tax=Quercus suber TaxID=58331 RepID=A0AAW0KRP1_QUESU